MYCSLTAISSYLIKKIEVNFPQFQMPSEIVAQMSSKIVAQVSSEIVVF